MKVVADPRKISLNPKKMMESLPTYSAVLETKTKQSLAVKTPMKNGKPCLQNRKKRESRIFGARPDVITINSDFKLVFKKWLNPT
jgi:hypothetical protein